VALPCFALVGGPCTRPPDALGGVCKQCKVLNGGFLKFLFYLAFISVHRRAILQRDYNKHVCFSCRKLDDCNTRSEREVHMSLPCLCFNNIGSVF